MAKSFTKTMVVESYRKRFGGTFQEAEEKLYWFQELIQQEVYRGFPINFPMIGKFVPAVREARVGRNPKNGEAVKIKKSYVVRFKPSRKMKQWLNKNR